MPPSISARTGSRRRNTCTGASCATTRTTSTHCACWRCCRSRRSAKPRRKACCSGRWRSRPDFLVAWLDLGQLRNDLDRYAEALECFDRVLAVEPNNVQALYLRAQTLAPAGFTAGGHRRRIAQCLALRADHIGALLGMGHALKAVGQYQEAVDAYNACIRQRPEFGETYWSLANLKTYRFDDARARAACSSASRRADSRRLRKSISCFAIAQGVRRSWRIRSRLGVLSRAATGCSARKCPTTRCRPR